MYDGDQLKYGWISGGKAAIPVAMGASEIRTGPGAGFGNMDATGYFEYHDDGDDEEVFGSVESPYGTGSTVEGGDSFNCIYDHSAAFKVPVLTGDGTFAITMIGDTCDTGMTGNVIGVDMTASNDEHYIILAGDLTNNNWVIVRLNPFVQGETDVA